PVVPRRVFPLAALPAVVRATAPPRADDPAPADPPPAAPAIDKADTAWMLVSTGLVMFMVPGLALFYGGIARRKNLLGTMMHSMIALGIVGVQWVLFGYSLTFGASQGGYIGWEPKWLGPNDVLSNTPFMNTTIPAY